VPAAVTTSVATCGLSRLAVRSPPTTTNSESESGATASSHTSELSEANRTWLAIAPAEVMRVA
jgi:hypothetical protein